MTVTGKYLTGATLIAIHDIPCPFTVVNDTTITFTIPAMTPCVRPIKVITPGGKTWSAANFTVN